MIVFYGELSEKCRKYILMKETRVSVIAALIVSCLFSITIIICTILIDWIFIVALPVFVLFFVLSWLPPSKKNYVKIFPKRIVINDGIISSEGDNFHYNRLMSQIKLVVDMGEWYDIIFYYNYRNPRFICQKDLLIEGTLEGFEQFFKDKITRKVK